MQFQDSKLANKAAVVGVTGRMDASSTPLFEAHCDDLIKKGEKSIVLDFTDLEYLSSAGLRSILSLAKKLKVVSGKVVISGARGTVKDIFDISGFSELFPMCDTLEQAAAKVL